MSLGKWLEEATKKIRWYDIGFIKITMVFFTLFLITAWSGFRELTLSIEWYWYLVFMVIFATPVYIRMLID